MVGAAPSFTDVHLVRALLRLHEKPTGRKKLVQILGLGEGSVRTVIKHLSIQGLVGSNQLGHALTARGASKVRSLLAKISKPMAVDLAGIVSGSQSMVVIYSGGERLKSIVDLRDTALKAGADGALILVFDERLKFPGQDIDCEDYPDIRQSLEGITLTKGDAVAVSFAQTPAKAEDGAVSVALKIIGYDGK